jgi:hypothetical protein
MWIVDKWEKALVAGAENRPQRLGTVVVLSPDGVSGRTRGVEDIKLSSPSASAL